MRTMTDMGMGGMDMSHGCQQVPLFDMANAIWRE